MTYPKIIDISWCQPTKNIDWQKLHDLGIGVIIRAGQADFTDSLFFEHVANAIKYKVPFAIYFFFQPNLHYEPQLAHFLEIWNSLPVKPIQIFLDVENIAYTEIQPDGSKKQINVLPPNALTHSAWLWGWLDGVEKATGITPGIYTRADYWNVWTLRTYNWSHWLLWVASWTNYSADIRLPADWLNWQVWQYEGGTGRQEGITGPVDLDYFNGTQDEMLAFFGMAPVVVTPPVESELTLESLDARLLKIESLPWYKQFFPIVNK
jgi:lysozyme